MRVKFSQTVLSSLQIPETATLQNKNVSSQISFRSKIFLKLKLERLVNPAIKMLAMPMLNKARDAVKPINTSNSETSNSFSDLLLNSFQMATALIFKTFIC